MYVRLIFPMTQDGGSSSQLWHSTLALYRQHHFKVAKEEKGLLLSHRRVSDLLAEQARVRQAVQADGAARIFL
jgi:hypothetical protein